MHIAPDLHGITDPPPFIQLFSERIHTGLLSIGGNSTWKHSVEKYLCSIGQIVASVVADNPRNNRMGKLNYRLG